VNKSSGVKVGNATRFVYGSTPVVFKKGSNTLKTSFKMGLTLTGVMNGDDVSRAVSRAVEFLETSPDNSAVIIQAVITRAILTYGAERATLDATTEKEMIVDLDTGCVTVDATRFLAHIFEGNLNQNKLRSFVRCFPHETNALLSETAVDLQKSYGIANIHETFSSLFPKGFSLNHKYLKGKIQENLKELEQEEVVHSSIV